MTVIFFGLYDVLIDPVKVRKQMPQAVGRVLAKQYGETGDFWAAAFERVRADWDSYYADLDLAGDDGVAALWEGMFRTTRAIFRLADRSEPPKPELTELARSLPNLAFSRVNCGYSDTVNTLRWLDTERHIPAAVCASISTGQLRGLLQGCLVRKHINAMLGLDVMERFHHDERYWQIAALKMHADPANCVVIDALDESIEGARAAGMRAYPFTRTPEMTLVTLMNSLPILKNQP